MVKIVPTHPHLISDYQDEILQSLDDEDVSIRMRALELISSMVSTRQNRAIELRLTRSNTGQPPKLEGDRDGTHIAPRTQRDQAGVPVERSQPFGAGSGSHGSGR